MTSEHCCDGRKEEEGLRIPAHPEIPIPFAEGDANTRFLCESGIPGEMKKRPSPLPPIPQRIFTLSQGEVFKEDSLPFMPGGTVYGTPCSALLQLLQRKVSP